MGTVSRAVKFRLVVVYDRFSSLVERTGIDVEDHPVRCFVGDLLPVEVDAHTGIPCPESATDQKPVALICSFHPPFGLPRLTIRDSGTERRTTIDDLSCRPDCRFRIGRCFGQVACVFRRLIVKQGTMIRACSGGSPIQCFVRGDPTIDLIEKSLQIPGLDRAR